MEANRKKTVTTYQYHFKYHRTVEELYWGISTHTPSGRQLLISLKSRENKEDTELLKTTARQRGMGEQQCWDDSEKASL